MFKTILDNVPKATALLSFCVLMLTVFHDWGYFSIVGIKFQSLQSPYDYLANSIAWLPFSVGVVAVYVAMTPTTTDIVQRRLFGAVDFESMPRRALETKITRQSRLTAVACATISLVSAVFWYFFRFPISVPAGCMVFISAYLAAFFAFFPDILFDLRSKHTALVALSVATIPVILAMSFAIGAFEALEDTESFGDVYAVQRKDGSVKQVLLLRSLDKGVLAYDLKTKQIAFTRWDVLAGLNHTFFRPKDESVCEITDHICGAPSPP